MRYTPTSLSDHFHRWIIIKFNYLFRMILLSPLFSLWQVLYMYILFLINQISIRRKAHYSLVSNIERETDSVVLFNTSLEDIRLCALSFLFFDLIAKGLRFPVDIIECSIR